VCEFNQKKRGELGERVKRGGGGGQKNTTTNRQQPLEKKKTGGKKNGKTKIKKKKSKVEASCNTTGGWTKPREHCDSQEKAKGDPKGGETRNRTVGTTIQEVPSEQPLVWGQRKREKKKKELSVLGGLVQDLIEFTSK